MNNFFRIVVLIATVGFALVSCLAPNVTGGSAGIGSPAPDFTLFTLERESASLSGLKGQPVFLNFWSYT